MTVDNAAYFKGFSETGAIGPIGSDRDLSVSGAGFSALGIAYKHHAFADRGRAGAGGHALAVEFDAGGSVTVEHLGKGMTEFAFEIEHLPVIRAKLLLQGCPGYEGWLAGVDAVQPLSEPGVNVEAHCRVS